LAHETANTVRWAIVHVWLLPEIRGQGIATDLVRMAVQGVKETPDTVGWLPDFSLAARSLLRRLTDVGFHRASHELPPFGLLDPPFNTDSVGRTQR
jgi:GNAT superfamily N-acetyltransferase